MPPTIEAKNLTKHFGQTAALSGLNLVAEHGQIVALLGPNGAGKTTFVRAVATLLHPDEGTLHVAGIDAVKQPHLVRQVIGLAGQYAAVETAMTGYENLEMVARLFGLDRRAAHISSRAILKQFGLEDVADNLVRTYSGGMCRRLDLAASMVGRPKLLLLDEPTTGLDPRSRIDLWAHIRELVHQGTDVLLTTQYLDEADQLASHIVIIDHGCVIAEGTPRELKARVGHDIIEIHVREPRTVETAAQVMSQLGRGEPFVDSATLLVSIPVDSGSQRLMDAAHALANLGVEIEDISLRRPSLDEVFLALTGKPVRES